VAEHSATFFSEGNLFCFIICVVAIWGCQSQEKQTSPLLLISFDGFKYDYFEKTDTPNFDEFISNDGNLNKVRHMLNY